MKVSVRRGLSIEASDDKAVIARRRREIALPKIYQEVAGKQKRIAVISRPGQMT